MQEDKMDHLDLAVSSEQEAVYSSNDEGGNATMSDRVSSLAAAIYNEFEVLIQNYGQGVLDSLMPMVVNVLEQLDGAYSENKEQALELEMLSEDNEQLITQYEREKQLRKLAETKYLEYEDAQDQEKRNLQAGMESLELQNRHNESKIKSYIDQLERAEERLTESKKEYSQLHSRHTEMIHMYMERMEHYRRMQSGLAEASASSKSRLHSSTKEEVEISHSQSQPALHVKSSLSDVSNKDHMNLNVSTERRNDLSFEDEAERQRVEHEKQQGEETVQDRVNTGNDVVRRQPEILVTSTPVRERSQDIEKHITDDIKVVKEGRENLKAERDGNTSKVLFSEEAQLILNTTPELNPGENQDVFINEPNLSSHSVRKVGLSVEELMLSQLSLDSERLGQLQEQRSTNPASLKSVAGNASSINDLSLFAELSSEEPSIMTDVESVSCFSPVGKELEGLIKENEELLDAKTKLQTQKNDLLQRVEEITREKEMLEEHVNGLASTKTTLKSRVTDLEQELKKTKHELEKSTLALKGKNGEERISSANRKRFTRVEMARVLMERNQYKERLMELQEAVRWTEMIRASKENHLAALQQKKKSTVWKFFNNLFAGSSSSATQPSKKSSTPIPLNTWYGSGQGQNSQHRRHNSVVGSTSPAIEGITERQKIERRERYKHVKEHISTEGRKQAYGWSLPANYSNEQEGVFSVPVPVYCRPLNTDPAMKIWCCSGVSLEGGRKPDGTFLGLPSDFKEPSPSTVWIGTSTHSCSKITILDANTPSTAIDQFIVCSSHLLCMTAVPGVSDKDFDLEDGFSEPSAANAVRKHTEKLQRPRPPIGPRSYSYGSGAEMRASHPGRKSSTQDLSTPDTTDSGDVSGVLTGVQTEEESFPDEDTVDGALPKVTSALPTMWLGAQSGKIYIHSAVTNWKKCLQSGKLRDSVLSIVEIRGRVLVALADGTVGIFHRKPDKRWDLSNYHLLDLGRPHHSIRCMTVVHGNVWCGYRNKVQVISPKNMSIEKSFDAHPRRESQVRQLACMGDGVWVSIRLDSTLRLYNAKTYHHLQDVDIEPYVSKMLGTGRYGYSFVRITALLLSSDRLWVGTGNGVILSIPLVAARPSRASSTSGGASNEGSSPNVLAAQNQYSGFMPYCSMVHAQLSFHGHRDSVKFFVSVNGSVGNISSAKAYTMAGARPPSPTRSPKKDVNVEAVSKPILVMSGGEGYIDFRVGDEEPDDVKGPEEVLPLASRTAAAERSHLLVWQINSN